LFVREGHQELFSSFNGDKFCYFPLNRYQALLDPEIDNGIGCVVIDV